jgi:hypothetical protein
LVRVEFFTIHFSLFIFPKKTVFGSGFPYLYLIDMSEGYQGVSLYELKCFLDTIVYLVGDGDTYTVVAY